MMLQNSTTVPCDCCSQPAARSHLSQEWGFCADCKSAGCMSKRDGDGGMLRGERCPLVMAIDAHGEVVMCLHCNKPLHRSEPLTYVDNSNPGLGGCHFRCVTAYHAARGAAQ